MQAAGLEGDMRAVIDRFEGDIALVETVTGHATAGFSRNLLEDAKEGDIIEVTILKHESDEKREEVNKIMDRLFDD